MDDSLVYQFARMLPPDSDNIMKEEFLNSMENIVPAFAEIDNLYQQLSIVAKAHKYIILHGITNAAIDDFGSSLETLGIEISSNTNITQCLEGLGAVIVRFWTSLKDVINRLMEYLRTDSYFSRWTNLNEMYRIKVATLITARERYYALIDETKFYHKQVLAIPYLAYVNKLNATASITSKLNLLGSTPYESIDIKERFGSDLEALGFEVEGDQMVPPETRGFVAGTLMQLQWTPAKVHYCTDILYRRILLPHLQIDRLLYQMTRTLQTALTECKAVLSASVDGSDISRINTAKARVRNLRAIKNITQYCIATTRVLSVQWIRMVELYDLSKVKVGQ